jgi:hypothetical protein
MESTSAPDHEARTEELWVTVECLYPDKALLYGKPLTEWAVEHPEAVVQLAFNKYKFRVEG